MPLTRPQTGSPTGLTTPGAHEAFRQARRAIARRGHPRIQKAIGRLQPSQCCRRSALHAQRRVPQFPRSVGSAGRRWYHPVIPVARPSRGDPRRGRLPTDSPAGQDPLRELAFPSPQTSTQGDRASDVFPTPPLLSRLSRSQAASVADGDWGWPSCGLVVIGGACAQNSCRMSSRRSAPSMSM